MRNLNPAATDMQRYYAERAPQYERVYAKPERQADLRALEAALAEPFRDRRVLELACGTGWWTPHGARHARRWLATDVNEETLAIARTKAMPPVVELKRVDAYTFDGVGAETFDGAFAGFWWSHVPLARLAGWIAALHARLAPGARVVFLDNRQVAGHSTPIARRDAEGNTYQRRTLDDGSVHEVLKNYPTREEAVAALGPRAREARWTETTFYWLLSYRLE